jgi:eukaryotic-like serine/threonine-protein kinase
LSLRCPSCGATYADTAKFCTRDGTRLPLPRTAAPAAQVGGPTPSRAGAAPHEYATLSGRTIDGRYRIESKLGEGGMSFVYLATDKETGERVAIKVLSPTLSTDTTSMARLRREADVGQRLEHPNICHIKRLGQTAEGLVYIVMPYIEGEVLADRTYRLGKLPLADVVRFVQQIASGLQVAHDLKIVHRDLKPENVIITTDDKAVVMDFGLAKERRAGAELEKLTATGIVLGTPEFMSPEQLRGKPLDGRTDVYALALMTFEMLTGKLPFEGKSQQELMIARLRDAPIPIRRLKPELNLSAGVEKVLLKGMERDPEHRYRTAPEFADALADAAQTSNTRTSRIMRLFGGA